MKRASTIDTGDSSRVQVRARVAGVLYLIIIVIGLLSETWVRGTLVVAGDPDATAARILGSPFLWRAGVAAEDVLLLCAVGLGYAWYLLLRRTDGRLIWLAMFLGLVSLAVESVGALQLHAVLTPLIDETYVRVAGPGIAHLMAYQAVQAHTHAFALALIFFGAECLVIGHLIRRSTYFPSFLGTVMQVVGVCYLVNSFSTILSPALQGMLFPLILLPCFLGESTFCLWLLIKGVDVTAWKAQAAHLELTA